jgi:hypothetical protein
MIGFIVAALGAVVLVEGGNQLASLAGLLVLSLGAWAALRG